MISVKIHYHATGIRAEYTPGNANFSYWIFTLFPHLQWHSKDEVSIDIVCDDLSPKEADRLEELAGAQQATGDTVNLEVIGKPVPVSAPAPVVLEPVAVYERVTEEQLSLF